jgi:RHS repeat-associated protein
MITDANCTVITQLGYEPFGSRRKADGTGQLTQAEIEQLLQDIDTATKRGYTDHEHLDRMGLIHMNGRIYDPVMGRFLSPDPLVQAPHFSQSYNRYTYTFNNPLIFTDPTGYGSQVDADPEQEQAMTQQYVVTLSDGSTMTVNLTTTQAAAIQGTLDSGYVANVGISAGGGFTGVSAGVEMITATMMEGGGGLGGFTQQISLGTLTTDWGGGGQTSMGGHVQDSSYRVAQIADGNVYNVRYHTKCASEMCLLYGANIDWNDSETKAWNAASMKEDAKNFLRFIGLVFDVLVLHSPRSVMLEAFGTSSDVSSAIINEDSVLLVPNFVGGAVGKQAQGIGLPSGIYERVGTGAEIGTDISLDNLRND